MVKVPLIWLDNVFHSLNATEMILNDMLLDLQTVSENVFVDLIP